LQPWDLAYYAEKQRQALYDFDDEALRPYFPAPRVLAGMFEVVHRLYGVTVTPTTELTTWHPDVQTYAVDDEHGAASATSTPTCTRATASARARG
jgi:oligopeptidase A